ncbi:MAG: 50S ribosomal protein L18 [Pseudomonadota bacterium]|jgi:large subunit ribosomal protein L18|nr:50S ribosomal protein L18 [Pseudomonadota bacterium]|tara:strand:- start:103 stop:456 length:354 start_codon:yes stop_codon:yes gene_type:complete
MKKLNSKIKRKIRNRKKLKDVNSDKLRITVFKSTKNISAQIIDDKIRKTLVSASTTEKELKKTKTKKMDLSNILGELLAKRAKEKKISSVYFDRGGYKYHGRIKALADSLRKNGLKI